MKLIGLLFILLMANARASGSAPTLVAMGEWRAVRCDSGPLVTRHLGPCIGVGLVGIRNHQIITLVLGHINPIADVNKMLQEMIREARGAGAQSIRATLVGGWEPSKGSPDLYDRITEALSRRAIPYRPVDGFTVREVKEDEPPPYIGATLKCDGTLAVWNDPF